MASIMTLVFLPARFFRVECDGGGGLSPLSFFLVWCHFLGGMEDEKKEARGKGGGRKRQ